MNQRVARLAEEKGHEIVGTIEREEHQHSPYKTYHHIADAQNEADVAHRLLILIYIMKSLNYL